MNKKLERTIDVCIKTVLAEQYRNGHIPSVAGESSAFAVGGPNLYVCKTTFHTSLVLSMLSEVSHPSVQDIARRAITFLTKECSAIGSVNYWTRASGNRSCPDDLDDTCAAYSACILHAKHFLDEHRLLDIIKLLIHNETKPGGPYYTWLTETHSKPWDDIDIGVNATIAHFLHKAQIESVPLVTYIEQTIQAGCVSTYYSPLVIIYYISSWYTGPLVPVLIKQLQSYEKSLTNPLERGLFVTSMLRLGVVPESCKNHVQKLASCNKKTLRPYPFYIEEIRQGTPIYSGSTAITAAVIAQALSVYTTKSGDIKGQAIVGSIKTKVLRRALTRFDTGPSDMQPMIQKLIGAVAKKDVRNEIILTPYLFADDTPPSILRDLAAANILGWIGYTIYDDILDGDSNISLLPIANIAVREVGDIFAAIVKNTPDYKIVQKILDGIDTANYWEHSHCKVIVTNSIMSVPVQLPDYKKYHVLAQKSFGHALGPILIYVLEKKRNNLDTLRKFFEHYLIAKQLNDDAHDWWKDLERGFINSVSTRILTQYLQHKKMRTIHLIKEKEKLQILFWNHTIDKVANTIVRHTKAAKKLLRELAIGDGEIVLLERLNSLESSALTAVQERDSTAHFLKLYAS